MMSDATTNPVKVIDGTVKVFAEDGHVLASFTGGDIQAWHQFQADVIKKFDVIVTDSSMPMELSKSIQSPDKRRGESVPSG
jgi:signal-transduction protein with cAMP-binding, CBS, and nucleotidyltransferase domain